MKIDIENRIAWYIEQKNCRWLNHLFRPFTKKQAELCEKIKANYNKMLNN